jgi:hypothetical protein
MLAPLRDVDKVVILADTMRGLTPDQVMDAIQAAIAAAYPDVTFERTRHALKVDFGAETFYFDTVPAWETTTDDDDILIANRETGAWERSNTRELLRVVAERNHATNGRFIHQVRMGKQAIKHLLDGLIPGLHVESWAFLSIQEPLAHDEAVARILETGAALLGQTYYEPTGVDAISARLEPHVLLTAKPLLERAAADARRARDLADLDDHDFAIRIWHGIFGDCFPTSKTPSDLNALRASFAVGAGITETGVVSRAATTHSARPVRPWRPA